MKQLVQDFETGAIKLIEAPSPALAKRHLLIQSLFSVVSAGTERATVSVGQQSLLGKARSRPDLVKKVLETVQREGIASTIQKVRARLQEYRALGYSSAGVVLEAGPETEGFSPGDVVACGGAGACHAEVVSVPQNLCAKVPEGVRAEHAAFTTLGAIALQGLRQAEAKLGETVAIIGLGLIGQLTVQIAKAAGCRVIGIDLRSQSVEKAKELGADLARLRDENVEAAIADFTQGYGVDAVLLTAATKSNDPVELAAAIARDRARIVVVGDVGLEVPRSIFYEKELELRLSRSYGPGRYDPIYEEKGIDYPIGYVRWTEKRNMEAFLQLLAESKINLEKIITHRFPIEHAPEAYELLLGTRQEFYLGILIEYPAALQEQAKLLSSLPKRVWVKKEHELQAKANQVRLGVIGAGNFAQVHLLPHLKAHPKAVLRGVATATSAHARKVADKFGFAYCTGDYQEILNDPEIDAVIIATRHNLHAPLVIEALRAGKAVFVEKPLALNEEELQEVIKAYTSASNPRLMVGFNRRFAPLIQQIQDLWGPKRGPWIVHYRLNAGSLPQDHWLHDPEEGGGRIIGEACHFIDLLQFLVGAAPSRVYAEQGLSFGDVPAEDNVMITLKFADGSLGTVSYFAVGDARFPKERIEIFGEGKAAVIDDFRGGFFSYQGHQKKLRAWGQDKGHKNEMEIFVDSILNGKPFPMPFEQIVLSMMTTFKAVESLRTGRPIEVGFK
jgi:predicted dehydrogenase/threonine dehydrogenase-like Zn-dependent dehydrogenase